MSGMTFHASTCAMARIAGIHISACESPKTTILLVDLVSPMWQMVCVVGSPADGEQPKLGNPYTWSWSTGGVRLVGTGAPARAAFTASTTAGSVDARGTAVASPTLADGDLDAAAWSTWSSLELSDDSVRSATATAAPTATGASAVLSRG